MSFPGRSWVAAGCILLSAGGVAGCVGSADTATGKEGASRQMTGRENRIIGEYLVTLQNGGDEAMIRQLYAPYSVKEVRSLGADLFLVRLGEDPGPEAVRRKGLESDRVKDVQPNFVYRLNSP